MGINTNIGTLLVKARQQGMDFGDVCTIGHQQLAIPTERIKGMVRRLGLPEPDWSQFAADGYANDFLKTILGAGEVRSIDYSDYQGADIIHDLNNPLPEQWHQRFDTLIDGGALEHIFDIRQVLANYLDLVRVNGNIILVTPANNLCGHGFYQFSPEFFYRVFSAANGYRVREMVLIESPLLSTSASRFSRMFDVADPAQVAHRIQLVNNKPVLIYVHAQRIEAKPLFSEHPQQSDYQSMKWDIDNDGEAGNRRPSQGQRQHAFQLLTLQQELLKRIRQRKKASLRNRRYFTRRPD